MQVQWTHFPLHPETPENGGLLLTDLFKGRDPSALAQAQERLRALAEQENLPWTERTRTYNSRLAQELGKWAEGQEGGEAIHDALFHAYFAEAKDISDPAVLLDLAEGVGLDRAAAQEVLDSRSMKGAVDADWNRSAQVGVTGVPTFVAGRYAVVGAQPYDVLERLVNEAGKPQPEADEAP